MDVYRNPYFILVVIINEELDVSIVIVIKELNVDIVTVIREWEFK